MSFANRLAIFAKTPKLGTVKTRLAAGIGDVAATAFYRRMLARTVRACGRDSRWQTYLAVTPNADVTKAGNWPRGVARITQGMGDLGQRMERVLRALPPGPAIIIGTDIPDVTPRHIASAFAALGDHDAVFGPASDGGYWLVGFRRRPAMPEAFANVRWSSEHALEDTVASLPPATQVAIIDILSDVDDAEAYQNWRQRRGR